MAEEKVMRAKYVEILTAEDRCRRVAEKWKREQFRAGSWIHSSGADIYERLVALGDKPRPDAVAEIIGNKSWSHISCAGCQAEVERAVSIGEYESRAYCPTCIAEAAEILGEQS